MLELTIYKYFSQSGFQLLNRFAIYPTKCKTETQDYIFLSKENITSASKRNKFPTFAEQYEIQTNIIIN